MYKHMVHILWDFWFALEATHMFHLHTFCRIFCVLEYDQCTHRQLIFYSSA